jgi:hypothetical protein
MEQPNKNTIMYFEFRKLVYSILPRVIFKAYLSWFESNPEFRPIRIRNYKYYNQHPIGKSSKFSRWSFNIREQY